MDGREDVSRRRQVATAPRRVYDWFDDRLGLREGQTVLGKAFPAEDSFLLGEVALFCFLVLVLTGVFLGFFYEPSTTDVTYQGSVAQFQGQDLPEAFVSVLHITYDIPYGMFLRRLHHWAAHLFVASIGLHMLRVFFTGAYRNPREINWVVGTGLAILAMFAAYTGYALPFDEFAATATGIGYTVAQSVPLVGEMLSKIVFGGEFPSSATIPRLYFFHVLVLPAAIAGLIAVHMTILVRQKHTEAPREDDVGEIDREDDSVVVGLPAVPNQVAVSAVVFFLTLAILSVLAGFLPVHNVAEYGPNDPAGTPGLIMPDWFLMWLFGFLKLWPSWATFSVAGIEFNAEFLGGVVLSGLVFALVALWPFLDRSEATHFTADPLARPARTGLGVAGVIFIMIASIAGMNNILATVLDTSTGVVNPVLTAALIVGPIVAGVATYLALGGSVPTRREKPKTSADGGRPVGDPDTSDAEDERTDTTDGRRPSDTDAERPSGGERP